MAFIDLKRRWSGLWFRLGAEGDSEVPWRELLSRYAEPHRAYHNLEHITDCLTQLDWVQSSVELPDETELALWLHDVIYDPQVKNNEQQSAAFAAQVMANGGLPAAQSERVTGLILATKHRAQPETPDEAIVMDIDLSILGRDPAEFDAYEARIREEYAWVSEAEFREGRARLLETFLQRETIFYTTHFQALYEIQARHNLKHSIARLRHFPTPE